MAKLGDGYKGVFVLFSIFFCMFKLFDDIKRDNPRAVGSPLLGKWAIFCEPNVLQIQDKS